jgi:predicted RNA-binding protein with PUA-like domain
MMRHDFLMSYWLMKSEPEAFSLEDLKASPKKTTKWDGIRNYQARNMMRDDMKKGDEVFFYHSNCKVPGIVGLAEISSTEAYPDVTQFDPTDGHYDPTSNPADPRWLLVDVRYKRHLRREISLTELRQYGAELGDFALTRKANRLSVMPVTEQQWSFILGLEGN